MIEDGYALLEVEQDSTEVALFQVYREKAVEHHPDVRATLGRCGHFPAFTGRKTCSETPIEA